MKIAEIFPRMILLLIVPWTMITYFVIKPTHECTDSGVLLPLIVRKLHVHIDTNAGRYRFWHFIVHGLLSSKRAQDQA
ncbi:hypothetical protein ALO43_200111 [Pseudomonas tremae]|uniref:Uncharacterized protein n=1 Tax=Pseudomonas tremae TaxID=200454 RepID=A0AA40TW26_9PSED|nr:hypothetical protein ALO43_200111 [Pseudomonas tremae]